MSKRIIFLTGYWDSRVDPTVVCIKSLLHHFIDNQYNVDICTYWGMKKEQNKRIDGYNVYYVRPHVSISLFDAYYQSKNRLFKQVLFIIAKVVNIIHRFLSIWHYPISSASFVKRWAKATISLIDPSEETILISVVNPEDSVYAGHIVKKQCPNIKWITYNLDCGSNVLPGSSFERFRKLFHNKSITAENKALTNADRIIVMKGHYDYYSTHLTQSNVQKLLVADIPLLQDTPRVSSNNLRKISSDCLKFVYAGTMTGIYYNPKSICNFFIALREYLPNATLDLYGITDKESYLKALTNAKVGITYHGVINHDDLEAIFEDSDILVYYKNERIDSVSGKFFEYLSYMKPVIYYGIAGDINFNNVLKYDYGLSLDCKKVVNESVKETLLFIKGLEDKQLIDYAKVKDTYEMNLSSYAYSIFVNL